MMNKEELAMKAATFVVKAWESIPEKVAKFNAQSGELGTRSYEDTLKEAAGGLELYETCKRFLMNNKC